MTGRRHLGANVWNFRKDRLDYRIYVTDARGVVVYDSAGSDLGKDYSQWNDVYRTLRGRYGARSSRDESGHDTVMHVAAPIVDDAGRIIGVLGVANPNRTTQPFIAASQQEILRKGGILLSVHADDGEWAKRARQVLEQSGAEDIGTTAEARGDYANSDRPARRA